MSSTFLTRTLPLGLYLSTLTPLPVYAGTCAELFQGERNRTFENRSSQRLAVHKIPPPTFPERAIPALTLDRGVSDEAAERRRATLERHFPEEARFVSGFYRTPDQSALLLVESGSLRARDGERGSPLEARDRRLVIFDGMLETVSHQGMVHCRERDILYLSNQFFVERILDVNHSTRVVVRRIDTGSEVISIPVNRVTSVSIDATEKIGIVTDESNVRLFDLERPRSLDVEATIQRQLAESPQNEWLSRSAISPDGRLLAIGTEVRMEGGASHSLARTHIFDLRTGERQAILEGVKNRQAEARSGVDWIRFNTDGTRLFVVFFPIDLPHPALYMENPSYAYSGIEADPAYRPPLDSIAPWVQVYEIR